MSEHELTQEEYQRLLLEHSDFKHAIDDLTRRLKNCESQQEAINALTLSVDRLTTKVVTIADGQGEIKEDVKALKESPIESYKHFKRTTISCIITTIVGAIVGAVISLILSKGGI